MGRLLRLDTMPHVKTVNRFGQTGHDALPSMQYQLKHSVLGMAEFQNITPKAVSYISCYIIV
jgi:hypothetical protein